MQNDPNKAGFNNYGNVYGNSYGPMNQPPPPPPAGFGYPPNNAPPPYTQYPQQPSSYPVPGGAYNGSIPTYQQQRVTVVPTYRPFWNNLVLTPITPGIKAFLVISGILYLIWGILAIGFEIGIIRYSYWRYYTGLWAGAFLVGGGISMLIAACKPSFVMANLIRMFITCLMFCILGLILSIVYVSRSTRCDSIYFWYYCDYSITAHLKVAMLALFITATIHTIVNIIVINNARKATASTRNQIST
ncbi:unnamed protein product [Rotaria magnacalcarata]|uniref:Uncharacterized protein n=1 Tax=Rotaria magnacalcarata TaxID=392030 RepID=A0A815S7H1_9BILA|nr:unnamed protein product [Rotaria magnacalcarata]CAF4639869.1 unnamed protein product [Rotaria magnacalcarata]